MTNRPDRVAFSSRTRLIVHRRLFMQKCKGHRHAAGPNDDGATFAADCRCANDRTIFRTSHGQRLLHRRPGLSERLVSPRAVAQFSEINGLAETGRSNEARQSVSERASALFHIALILLPSRWGNSQIQSGCAVSGSDDRVLHIKKCWENFIERGGRA